MRRLGLGAVACAGIVALSIQPAFAAPARINVVVVDGSFEDWTSSLRSVLDDSSLALLSTLNADDNDREATSALLGGKASRSALDARASVTVVYAAFDAIREVDLEADVLVLVSFGRPAARASGVHLGAIAIRAPGFAPGLLTSPTTRRAGVISVADVAPTILDAVGAPVPDELDGRVAHSVKDARAPEHVLALQRQVLRAHDLRHPLTRMMLFVAMALVAIATWMVVYGRGAQRRLVSTALACAAALPVSVFAVGAIPLSKAPAIIAIFSAALLMGMIARRWGMLVVVGITSVVPLVDLLIGSPIADRSPLAPQVAIGGRFYGVDDDVLGMVVGALLIAVGLGLDRARRIDRGKVAGALAFASAIVIMGAPGLGAKFGAPLTAIPGFGVVAVRIGGRRITKGWAAIIALGTLVSTALFVLVDRFGPAASQSHIGRAASGRSDLGDLLQRKVEATARLATTAWVPAIVVFGGALLYLLLKRRAVLDRGFWGRPYLRAGLVGASVSAIVALFVQDGGQTTSALILLPASTTALSVLIGPEDRR